MRRQESDDRVVPEGRRNANRTDESLQGKAVTVSKQVGQLGLFVETAEQPKSAKGKRTALPRMNDGGDCR